MIEVIGDLHPPLYAGNGTDRGGNDFAVTFFGKTTNLHAVWDSTMADDEQLSYSEMSNWLEQRITPELATSWGQTDPLVWIEESTTIRDEIYPEERNLDWGTFSITVRPIKCGSNRLEFAWPRI